MARSFGPGRGPGQLEVREVGAGDEQHGPRQALQQPDDHGAGAVHGGLVEGHDVEAPTDAVLGVVVGPLGAEGLEASGHLGRGGAVLEAADGLEETAVAVIHHLRGHGDGPPQVDLAEEERVAERGRHDPDDRHRLGVEANRPADDSGIAPEPRLPQVVAQEHDLVPTRHALVGGERATHERRHPKGREEVGGGVDGLELLRRMAGLGHRVPPPRKGGERLERRPGSVGGRSCHGGAHLLYLGDREPVALLVGGRAVDGQETLGIGKGGRPEQKGIHQGVHRGVHADAQCQGQ